MGFRLSELKKEIQEGRANFTVEKGGLSEKLGGVEVPDVVKVKVPQYDESTGEKLEDIELTFDANNIKEREVRQEIKIKRNQDELYVIKEIAKKLK